MAGSISPDRLSEDLWAPAFRGVSRHIVAPAGGLLRERDGAYPTTPQVDDG